MRILQGLERAAPGAQPTTIHDRQERGMWANRLGPVPVPSVAPKSRFLDLWPDKTSFAGIFLH